MFLQKEITELESMIADYVKINIAVSSKEIGWHIDHCAKVIIAVCKTIQKSNPADYKWQFNVVRFLIFTTGIIPRGRGRSPKSVLPPEKIKKEDIKQQIETAKKLLLKTENLPKKSNFKHPYFGILNLKMTKKFLKLHTVHHLKIMKDIIKK